MQSKPSEDIHALAATLAAKPETRPAVVVRERKPVPFVPEFLDCEKHGKYPANMVDSEGVVRYMRPVCPACERQAAVVRLMRRAAVSPRFERCTFENFEVKTEDQRKALQVCREYAENFAEHLGIGRCLILRGNPGTGKNHLATAICKVLIENGYAPINATAYELIRRIRETWRDGSRESEEDVYRQLAGADLLIIDEVGRQYSAKDGTESIELFNIIDRRNRDCKPTAILSNQTREGIARYLGAAAFDRLRQGGGKLANFDWDSHRGVAV